MSALGTEGGAGQGPTEAGLDEWATDNMVSYWKRSARPPDVPSDRTVRVERSETAGRLADGRATPPSARRLTGRGAGHRGRPAGAARG